MDSRETSFASAARTPPEHLEAQIAAVAGSPITTTLLDALGGIAVVLNAERQIVGFNAALGSTLGLEDPAKVLGLRPGEALDCVYEKRAPSGCGTGVSCRTCGAALAILANQEDGQTAELECLLLREIDGEEVPCEFLARTTTTTHEAQAFTLLTLQGIQEKKALEALLAGFLHDLRNLSGALLTTVDCLDLSDPAGAAECLEDLRRVARLLADTTRMQSILFAADRGEVHLDLQAIRIEGVLEDMVAVLQNMPEARDLALQVSVTPPTLEIRSDPALLCAALINGVKNAIEASEVGATVQVRAAALGDRVEIRVINPGVIPPEIFNRVFQRHFSTKVGTGRGLGAYGARLLIERTLGGALTIACEQGETVFRIVLPRVLQGSS